MSQPYDSAAHTQPTTDQIINGDVSFWYQGLGGIPNPRPALPGDQQVDVCIIGAGYTGLWTAYYLKKARPELSIIIIEREFAGFGASGRNGGWLSGEFGWSRETYAKTHGRSNVIEMDRELRASVDEVIRVANQEKIEADIAKTGRLIAATSTPQLQRLKEEYQEHQEWQVPDDVWLNAAQAQEYIGVHNIKAGIYSPHSARVQPAKLARGLAEVVEKLGVTIYEQTAVTSFEPHRVNTTFGTVTAGTIVRATEGFTAQFKQYHRDVLPMNSAMIVTEKLSDATWKQIGWNKPDLLGDAAHGYIYAQRTADGRIAIGGRGIPYRFGSATDVNGATQPATIKMLRELLIGLFPALNGVKVEQAWCGVLGVPRDWCASAGYDKSTGIAWAGGYVGIGVSTSNMAGRTLRDLILEENTELTQLPWVNHTVRKWEPEPARWLGVQGIYSLYRYSDRKEAQSKKSQSSVAAKLAGLIAGR